MMLYNIPFFSDTKDFLIAVARSRGRLKKGGIPDLTGAARMILRDWNAGRIPYYTVPSASAGSSASVGSSSSLTAGAGSKSASTSLMKSTDDVGSAAIVSSLAPEFDLDNLFKEADSGALEGLKTSKEMGPGSVVKLHESIMGMSLGGDEDGGDLKLMGEKDASDEIEDEEEDVPMLVPAPTTKAGKKRQASEDNTVSMPPQLKQKRVAFNTALNTISDGSAVSQKAKMFADTPEEAPVQLNKAIKQSAKKEKKKKARAEKYAMEQEAAANPAAASATTAADGKPKPYDFAAFFGAPVAAAVADEDEDM